ncbi:hypothetical protein THARTR1_00076 [Trichoderma harzianum]|uniref:Uncharacterized protein n=1 Tax=Trichoderma harzianum TaxID=5544 RepID=A0A2K0UQK2_TRIHA|nr:hypothetical protein THARTR1_00076 [Trichoderma harzianum]
MSYGDPYQGPTIEVVAHDLPWNPRHRRQINIDLGATVSAEADSGRQIIIIVEEPVEGNDVAAVPWQLIEGWFYFFEDAYVISLLVQDRVDYENFGGYYTGRSARFLFSVDPLRITLLD